MRIFEKKWYSIIPQFLNSAKMPSPFPRDVGRWDLNWMKGPRKASKDFRERIILENSKLLNSSYNAISVSKSRRKKVPVMNGEGLCYAPYGPTGTRTARRSRVMKKAASVRDCAAQPRNGRSWLNNHSSIRAQRNGDCATKSRNNRAR